MAMRPVVFADHVDTSAGPDACWPWTKRKNRDGYGEYNRDGGKVMAHRHAWALENGAIPAGQVIRHKCDNPACCNPAHMELGTHSDNQRDKFARNRHARGESLGSAILTESQVRDIRSRYQFRKTTMKMLAAEFGVCKDTIRKAVKRVYWSHVA